MTRQYVSIKFRPGDTRAYTYHNDGKPVNRGDKIVVETARGKQTVTVFDIVDEAPPFVTKSIILPVDPKAALIDE